MSRKIEQYARAAQFDISVNVARTLEILVQLRPALCPRPEKSETPDQARDFENGADCFLQASQRELAAIGFDLLHSLDKRRQARAVDVSDTGKIDY